MEISKTTLVVTVIICVLLGVVGYELLLGARGVKLEQVEKQPELSKETPVAEIPVDEPAPVEPIAPPEERVLTAEVTAADAVTPEAGEVEAGGRVDVGLDLNDEESRRLSTVLGFKASFVRGNKLFTAGDVFFPGIDQSVLTQLPLALTKLEYLALNKILESSDEAGGKAAVELSDYIYQLLRDDMAVTRYFLENVIPTIQPEDQEIEAFFVQYGTSFIKLDERYQDLAEHLKEAIRVYLLKENLVRYMAAAYQEFILMKRLKLNWLEQEVPWGLPSESTDALFVASGFTQTNEVRPVFEDGGVEALQEPVEGVEGAVEGVAGASEGTQVSPSILQDTDPLFTIDDEIIPAGIINTRLLALNVPLVARRDEENLSEIVLRIIPPAQASKEDLGKWLGSFGAADRERVTSTLFAALARARMRDSKVTYEGYSTEHLKLVAAVSVASYAAEAAKAENQKLGYEVIERMPMAIRKLTSGCFNPTGGVDPSHGTIWMSLYPYTDARWIRIFPRNPLKHLDISHDQVSRMLLAGKRILRYDQYGRQMHMSDPGGRPLDFNQEDPARFMMAQKLGRAYPLAAYDGLIRGVYLTGDPFKDVASAGPMGEMPAEGVPLESMATTEGASDEYLEKMYTKHSSLFKLGSAYRFRILFHPDIKIVETAREKLLEGVEFREAVFRYGLVFPSGIKRRLYPAESRKPSIAKALSPLNVGEVSGIFEIGPPGGGYAMVHLMEKAEPREIAFDESFVKEMLREYYYADYIHSFCDEVLSKGGGYVKNYSYWMWPAESKEISKMLAGAATLLDGGRM